MVTGVAAVWHAGLKCFLIRAEFDFENHCLWLYLREGNCTDMQGAIDFAEAMDPQVRRIYTLAGRNRDTCYQKVGTRWESRGGLRLRSR